MIFPFELADSWVDVCIQLDMLRWLVEMHGWKFKMVVSAGNRLERGGFRNWCAQPLLSGRYKSEFTPALRSILAMLTTQHSILAPQDINPE